MKNKDIETVQKNLGDLINFYKDKNVLTTKYEDKNLPLLRSDECFKETLDDLDRAKREFDASLFFILMFGPLKAGKSTLTNLLARQEDVSPTGFGAETTLRPSLIIKRHKQDCEIVAYEAIDTRDNQEELFNYVMDCLRGILDFQSIKSRVRRTSIPLTRQNVEERLIRPLDIEPLITVLYVPGGELVTEHVALIDMPGLDGVKSNWEDSVVHKWILKRADFLIFIQSSMAALNKSTLNYLKDAYLGSRRPPLWLVQNIIDATYWRSEERRKSDNDTQRQNAKEYISSSLGISEDLRSTAINLGKASDGMKGEMFSDLLNESRFLDFENELKEILNESRVRIQQENSVKGVRATVRICKDRFINYREELKERDKEYGRQIKKLAEPKKILKNVYKEIKPDALKDYLEKELEKYVVIWMNNCKENLRKEKLAINWSEGARKNLGKRVEEAVDAINAKRKYDLENLKNKPEVPDLAKRYIDEVSGKELKEINECLQDLDIKIFEKEILFVPKWKGENVSFLIPKHISGELSKISGFRLNRKEDKLDKEFEHFCDNFKMEYSRFVERLQKIMIDEISSDFDKWITDSYLKEIADYLDDRTEQKAQDISKKREKLEDTKDWIEELETMCNELEQLCNKVLEAAG